MLAEKLVEIIEARSDELAMKWYRDVKDSQYTPNFKWISEEEALAMATRVFQKLGYWLLPHQEHEVKDTYLSFGSSMYYKGFRLEEVVMTLVLIKRHLWLHLLEEGIMTTNIDVYQALDVNNKVVLYFDRAIYFSLVGYKDAKSKSP